MRKILNLILKDLTAARRDNIVLYMIISPIMIAIIISFIIPSFESSNLTFVVESKEKQLIEELNGYGKVIEVDNPEDLNDRVNESDDVAGIAREGKNYKIILEGNENAEVGEAAGAVIEKIARGSQVAGYKFTVIGDGRSLFKQYAAILIVLMSILMPGMVVGFNIIDEKESGAIKAVSVSPITLSHYLIARGIIVLVLSLIVSIVSSLIMMGINISFWRLVVGVIFSAGIGVLMGLLIGGLADNQIKGVAIIKILVFPYTLIPIASIFVPERFLVFFYPFPNYWIFRIFQNVFIDISNTGDYWLSNILTIAITIVLSLIMVMILRKRLSFR